MPGAGDRAEGPPRAGTRRKRKPRQYDDGEWEGDGGGGGWSGPSSGPPHHHAHATGLPPPSGTGYASQSGGPCDHCGRRHSPAWRRGPPTSPHLCNACGVRYLNKGTLDGYVPGGCRGGGGGVQQTGATAATPHPASPPRAAGHPSPGRGGFGSEFGPGAEFGLSAGPSGGGGHGGGGGSVSSARPGPPGPPATAAAAAPPHPPPAKKRRSGVRRPAAERAAIALARQMAADAAAAGLGAGLPAPPPGRGAGGGGGRPASTHYMAAANGQYLPVYAPRAALAATNAAAAAAAAVAAAGAAAAAAAGGARPHLPHLRMAAPPCGAAHAASQPPSPRSPSEPLWSELIDRARAALQAGDGGGGGAGAARAAALTLRAARAVAAVPDLAGTHVGGDLRRAAALVWTNAPAAGRLLSDLADAGALLLLGLPSSSSDEAGDPRNNAGGGAHPRPLHPARPPHHRRTMPDWQRALEASLVGCPGAGIGRVIAALAGAATAAVRGRWPDAAAAAELSRLAAAAAVGGRPGAAAARSAALRLTTTHGRLWATCDECGRSRLISARLPAHGRFVCGAPGLALLPHRACTDGDDSDGDWAAPHAGGEAAATPVPRRRRSAASVPAPVAAAVGADPGFDSLPPGWRKVVCVTRPPMPSGLDPASSSSPELAHLFAPDGVFDGDGALAAATRLDVAYVCPDTGATLLTLEAALAHAAATGGSGGCGGGGGGGGGATASVVASPAVAGTRGSGGSPPAPLSAPPRATAADRGDATQAGPAPAPAATGAAAAAAAPPADIKPLQPASPVTPSARAGGGAATATEVTATTATAGGRPTADGPATTAASSPRCQSVAAGSAGGSAGGGGGGRAPPVAWHGGVFASDAAAAAAAPAAADGDDDGSDGCEEVCGRQAARSGRRPCAPGAAASAGPPPPSAPVFSLEASLPAAAASRLPTRLVVVGVFPRANVLAAAGAGGAGSPPPVLLHLLPRAERGAAGAPPPAAPEPAASLDAPPSSPREVVARMEALRLAVIVRGAACESGGGSPDTAAAAGPAFGLVPHNNPLHALHLVGYELAGGVPATVGAGLSSTTSAEAAAAVGLLPASPLAVDGGKALAASTRALSAAAAAARAVNASLGPVTPAAVGRRGGGRT